MRQESRPRKALPELRAEVNPQAPEVPPSAKTPPLPCDVEQASPPKECPICGAVLEPTVESCSKCRARVDEETEPARSIEKRPFKPYANINSPVEKELYERLAQALSEMDPRQRPWCGIGVKVGLLAVSPRDVTVAEIREVSGVQKGVVHVPRNWRELWYVETADGERRHIRGNPCEQAEQAICTIKHSLESFLRANGERLFPRIKCLIIFPDGHDFEGPKDFSIVQEPDEVITLNLRNLRDLPEAILQLSQGERLDSRKYRKWIESTILRSQDDSILGTWLDPAFDPAPANPPKEKRRWFGHLGREGVSVGKEEPLGSGSSRMKPAQKKMWSILKVTTTVITGMIIGMIGWRMYNVAKPIHSTSYSHPVSPPRAENPPQTPKVIQVPPPQDIPLSKELEKQAILSPPQSIEPREPQATMSRKKDQPTGSANKPQATRTQAPKDSELTRNEVESQIHKAVLDRGVAGVTVFFFGGTAYLQGQVETESQKSAAGQAARSIPEVKEIRNWIEVNRLLSADD